MVNTLNEYKPDYIIHPGEYILELIETIGINQNEFATRIGITPKHLSNIINGKAGITADTAKSLQIAYNYDPQYWLNLQTGYEIALKEKKMNIESKNNERENEKWLEQFDYGEIIKSGYVKEIYDNSTIAGKVNNLLSFFNCSDINGCNNIYISAASVACRIVRASKSKPGNAAVWMRYGQIKADEQAFDLPQYNKAKFRENLLKIKKMTKELPDDFSNKIISLCKEAGICLLFVKEIKGAGMCGAAFWIKNKSIPCIQMSLRFKTNDHFWFTFFHEAGHIWNEHKKDICLDGKNIMSGGIDIEDKANYFARNILISALEYNEFISKNRIFPKADIREFAEAINIHPGIVVGRLQHDGKLPYNYCNDLKHKFEWSDKK